MARTLELNRFTTAQFDPEIKVTSVRIGAPLNPPDMDTFYQGSATGYIDYPIYRASALAQ